MFSSTVKMLKQFLALGTITNKQYLNEKYKIEIDMAINLIHCFVYKVKLNKSSKSLEIFFG